MLDRGPIYFETLLYLKGGSQHWLVEPWNGLSAVLFILLALYWAVRLKGHIQQEIFFTYAVVLLFVGGIGGTLYHALRSNVIYLLMDWVPIVLLTMGAVCWFCHKLVKKWWLATVIAVGGFILVLLMCSLLFLISVKQIGVNLAYVLLGVYVLTPIFIFLKRTNFQDAALVYAALLSFLLAVLCRFVDHQAWLPMGTHFLWHVFGAVAVHALLLFIWKGRKRSC
ncbi:hypothetical protein OAO01_04355 [Oligoflexia bacterium]|nr:hypothetical protein [Oligoflexia bacterium]